MRNFGMKMISALTASVCAFGSIGYADESGSVDAYDVAQAEELDLPPEHTPPSQPDQGLQEPQSEPDPVLQQEPAKPDSMPEPDASSIPE